MATYKRQCNSAQYGYCCCAGQRRALETEWGCVGVWSRTLTHSWNEYCTKYKWLLSVNSVAVCVKYMSKLAFTVWSIPRELFEFFGYRGSKSRDRHQKSICRTLYKQCLRIVSNYTRHVTYLFIQFLSYLGLLTYSERVLVNINTNAFEQVKVRACGTDSVMRVVWRTARRVTSPPTVTINMKKISNFWKTWGWVICYLLFDIRLTTSAFFWLVYSAATNWPQLHVQKVGTKSSD